MLGSVFATAETSLFSACHCVLATAKTSLFSACHCVLASAETSQSSACHCEPVRTLVWQSVLPAVKPSKLVLLQANPYALFRIRPKYYFLLYSAARRCGLPRRFAPRNDRGGTSLHPRTPVRLQHVIANQCAHWCGNPFPRRGTWQVGCCWGKFVTPYVFARSTIFCYALPQGERIATSLRSSQ